ncbi:MAG TPA: hypothetical protein VIK95_07170 [Egibacteraceae bacterium]
MTIRASWHWRCACDCEWVGPSDDSRCFGCGREGVRGEISLRRAPEQPAAA